jgi:hypothetical protein
MVRSCIEADKKLHRMVSEADVLHHTKFAKILACAIDKNIQCDFHNGLLLAIINLIIASKSPF